MQDVLELAGRADGEQQRPGQQGVGVELAHRRVDGRTGTVCLSVGTGEQALEALHGSIDVLKRVKEAGVSNLVFAIQTNILQKLPMLLLEQKSLRKKVVLGGISAATLRSQRCEGREEA